jgi:hypothetical protein
MKSQAKRGKYRERSAFTAEQQRYLTEVAALIVERGPSWRKQPPTNWAKVEIAGD